MEEGFRTMSGELFAPGEVAMDSPRLAWMKRHGIITWYDNGRRNGVEWCEAQWFAGFQVWWPLEQGFGFFALETAHFGDTRIGQGESEDEALVSLMTCAEARRRCLKLWNEGAA
jgi:hypothetical protein